MTGPAEQASEGRAPAPILFCQPSDSWALTFGVTPGPRWFLRPASQSGPAEVLTGEQLRKLRSRFIAAVHQWMIVSRLRPVLDGHIIAFARRWPIEQTTVYKVLGGTRAMSHEHLAVFAAAVHPDLLPTNKEVRRYLDGVLSSVNETLTELVRHRAAGQPQPKSKRLLGLEAMNAMTDVHISLDPVSAEETAHIRALQTAIGPALAQAVRAEGLAGPDLPWADDDLYVSSSSQPAAFGYVVGGQVIGAVTVGKDWLTSVVEAGWVRVGGQVVLAVDSWDRSGRPASVRHVVFERHPSLPWFGDEDSDVSGDPPEIHLALGYSTVDWSSGQPVLTRRGA